MRAVLAWAALAAASASLDPLAGICDAPFDSVWKVSTWEHQEGAMLMQVTAPRLAKKGPGTMSEGVNPVRRETTYLHPMKLKWMANASAHGLDENEKTRYFNKYDRYNLRNNRCVRKLVKRAAKNKLTKEPIPLHLDGQVVPMTLGLPFVMPVFDVFYEPYKDPEARKKHLAKKKPEPPRDWISIVQPEFQQDMGNNPMEGGRYKKLPIGRRMQILQEMLAQYGYAYWALHGAGFLHLDGKPTNVFLKRSLFEWDVFDSTYENTNNSHFDFKVLKELLVVVNDFDRSKPCTRDEMLGGCTEFNGTIKDYAAPPTVAGKYGPEVDWWAWASTAFEMLAFKSPFSVHKHFDPRTFTWCQHMSMCKFGETPELDAFRDLLGKVLEKPAWEKLQTRESREAFLSGRPEDSFEGHPILGHDFFFMDFDESFYGSPPLARTARKQRAFWERITDKWHAYQETHPAGLCTSRVPTRMDAKAALANTCADVGTGCKVMHHQRAAYVAEEELPLAPAVSAKCVETRRELLSDYAPCDCPTTGRCCCPPPDPVPEPEPEEVADANIDPADLDDEVDDLDANPIYAEM